MAAQTAAAAAVRAISVDSLKKIESLDGLNVKIVYLVRHAQGLHNEAYETSGSREAYKDWRWEDSRLTEKGCGQALALRPQFAELEVDAVLVSPLTRAIQTARLAIPKSPQPFLAVESIRERIGTHPCDKRRSATVLAAEFPEVDFSGLNSDVDCFWSEEREPWEDLVQRSISFVDYVTKMPAKKLAVFTHKDFLQALLLDGSLAVEDSLKFTFDNAQMVPIALVW